MPEYRNQFLPLAIAFAAGVAVGANWPQIKKQIGPLLEMAGVKLDDIYSQLAEFLAERKERVEDRMAERHYTKKRPAARQAKTAKAASPAAAADVSSAEAAFLAGLEAVARKAPKKTRSRSRKPRVKKPELVQA
jgi:hypothetical protein